MVQVTPTTTNTPLGTPDLASIERRLAVLEKGGINRNLDSQSKDLLQEYISQRIIDIVWDRYFYYYNPFESLDGWTDDAENSGLHAISNGRLFLRTGAADTNVAYARKQAGNTNMLSFDFHSRFRASFAVDYVLDTGALTDVSVYVGTGYAATGVDHIYAGGLDLESHYGFSLVDSTLYGITCDGSNTTTLQLLTGVQHFENLIVEARHYPGYKVSFHIGRGQDVTDGDPNVIVPMKEYGSITTTLPSGYRSQLAEFAIRNDVGGGEDREMDAYFVEIIQERQRN